MRSADFTPVYFGPSDRHLFGWLHRPRRAALAGLGVVICNPLGYEEICAHRTLRRLAESLAEAGLPVLRFDYDGTGDSAGSDQDSGRVDAWLRSVRVAVQTLRQEAQVARVAIVGMRMGFALAAMANVPDLEALVGVAPVVKPRSYLREVRALHAGSSSAGSPPLQGGVEAAGFFLSDETQTGLQGLDLDAATVSARRVLMLDRDDLPAARSAADRMRERDMAVDYDLFTGYCRMMSNPHASVIPEAAIVRVVEWLQRLAETSVPDAADNVQRVGEPVREASTWMFRDSLIRESVQGLDPTGRLLSVVTEPASGAAAAARRAILLLNAGATHHIGPGRMYADIARRAAAAGMTAMRMDISGIGDSVAFPGQADNVVYSPRAVREVLLAVEALRGRFKVNQVVLMGLCSGAYHALKAALARSPVDMVIMLNPLTFHWTPDMSLDEQLSPHRVVDDVNRYRRNVLQAGAWIKLLRGQVNLPRALRSLYAHTLTRLKSWVRERARGLGLGLFADDLGAQMEKLAARGTRMLFVFSSGEPGADLLRAEAGSVVGRLQSSGGVLLEFIEGADHTFTGHVPRESMIALVFSHIGCAPA